MTTRWTTSAAGLNRHGNYLVSIRSDDATDDLSAVARCQLVAAAPDLLAAATALLWHYDAHRSSYPVDGTLMDALAVAVAKARGFDPSETTL